MDLWLAAVISALFLAAAALLMRWHVQSWKAARRGGLDSREEDFRRRQYRRRMQTSAMLGVLAAALFVGQLLNLPPRAAVWYWGAMLLLVAWLVLLALADMLATKYHFGRLRQDCLVERAKLRAELDRIQRARSNGKPKPTRPGSGSD